MARAVQHLSRYPLVLLTNRTRFPDGSEIKRRLWKLNVQVVPVYDVVLPGMQDDSKRADFLKLQVWRLQQFDKLVWLDTDAIMFRSLDFLFTRRPMWAGAQDDESCSGSKPGSSLWLVEPNEATYQSLMEFAAQEPSLIDEGATGLVERYFAMKVGQPFQMLESWEASSGACLGRAKGIPIGSSAVWNFPAFVHKSSPANECFYFDTGPQIKDVKGTMVNLCHYHPLGHYWRDRFCEAVRIVNTSTDDIAAYCDDFQWNMFAHRQSADMSDVFPRSQSE
jgi:hypothetical protein